MSNESNAERRAVIEQLLNEVTAALNASDEELMSKLSEVTARMEVLRSRYPQVYNKLAKNADALLLSSKPNTIKSFLVPIKKILDLEMAAIGPGEPSPPTSVTIRISQEPLAAANLADILTEITRLHTKCWLIASDRFSDLIHYEQSYDPNLEAEADLHIGSMHHNSPADISLVDLGAIGQIFVVIFEALIQWRPRFRAVELENERRAAEKRQQEEKHGAELADQEVAREKARIAADRERLQLDAERVNYALELAGKAVDKMAPGASPEIRARLVQTLLPQILRLLGAPGLGPALPPAPTSRKTTNLQTSSP